MIIGKVVAIVAGIAGAVVVAETQINQVPKKVVDCGKNPNGCGCPHPPPPVVPECHSKPPKPVNARQNYTRPLRVQNPNRKPALVISSSSSQNVRRRHRHHSHHGHRGHKKPCGRPRREHRRRHSRHHHKKSSSSSSHKPYIHTVEIKKDKGFYPFKFGRSHTVVPVAFHYTSDKATIVTISDCNCEGDSFKFFDNGVYIGTTDQGCHLTQKSPNALGPLLSSSSYYLPDADCPECVAYDSNPVNCLNDGMHCFGQAVLLPGSHNITMHVERSCDKRRVAYIRVDTACVDTGNYVPCCQQGIGCVNKIHRWWKKDSTSESSSSSSGSKSSHHHRRRHHRKSSSHGKYPSRQSGFHRGGCNGDCAQNFGISSTASTRSHRRHHKKH